MPQFDLWVGGTDAEEVWEGLPLPVRLSFRENEPAYGCRRPIPQVCTDGLLKPPQRTVAQNTHPSTNGYPLANDGVRNHFAHHEFTSTLGESLDRLSCSPPG
jgi:hypothetical protein